MSALSLPVPTMTTRHSWVRRRLSSFRRDSTASPPASPGVETVSEDRTLTPSPAPTVAESLALPVLPPINRVASPLPPEDDVGEDLSQTVEHTPDVSPPRKLTVMSSDKPPGAHHHALDSYDILVLIMENLVPRLCGDDGAKSALSAALVCRAFAEPASNVVWREPPDLTPLWNILYSPHLIQAEMTPESGTNDIQFLARGAHARAVSQQVSSPPYHG